MSIENDKPSSDNTPGALDGPQIKKNLPKFGRVNKNEKEKSADVLDFDSLSKKMQKTGDLINQKIGNGIKGINFYSVASSALETGFENVKEKNAVFEVDLSAKGDSTKNNIGVNAGTAKSAENDVVNSSGHKEEKNHIKEKIFAELTANGDLKDGKAPSLEAVAKALVNAGVIDPDAMEKMEIDEREKMLNALSQRMMLKLREEKGLRAEEKSMRAAPGASTQNAQNPQGQSTTLANEAVAATGAAIGGLAALTVGAVKLAGSTAYLASKSVAALGRKFDGVAVRPTISEYRVKQAEQAVEKYDQSVDAFWKIEAMAVLRNEIKERARVSGVSEADLMAKMKPGGADADLHEKFVKSVNDSPDATQAKVAMDKSLKSYINQYGRGCEELLNADTEGSLEHRQLKKRLEGTKEHMLEKTGETPVFGGENESHAERLKAAIQAIMEKLKEVLNAVREKVFGGASHAPSP